MCGLVGMAGNLCIKSNKAFRTAQLVDQFRGVHSTGVAFVPIGAKEVIIDKELGVPNNLWAESNLYDNKGILSRVPLAVVGHNRAATIGDVTIDNAHPFKHEHIHGAHNGTLRVYSDLKGSDKYDVDSKALFHHISEEGARDTWSNFLGAAALSWWDDKEKTINLVRNKERPLHVAYFKKGTAIIWASEEWMIHAALESAGLEVDEGTDKLENPFMLKPNYLHSFKPSTTNIRLEEVVELEPKKYVAPATRYHSAIAGPKNGGKVTFNKTWAKDLEKGSKDYIGKIFTLNSVQNYTAFNSDDLVYMVKGINEDGVQVTLFPESFDEWEMWRNSLHNPITKDNIYKIAKRPRVVRRNWGQRDVFNLKLSTKSVELAAGNKLKEVIKKKEDEEEVVPLFKGAAGQLVTRKELIEDIEIAGGECGVCARTLEPEDKFHFTQNGLAVVCHDCEEWAGPLGMLGNMNNWSVN